MTIRIDTGDANATPQAGAEMQLVLTFSVDDAERLWDAAARRCGTVDDLTLDEIIETIGPREDPSIEDCIKMLALSPGLEGCTMSNVVISQSQAWKMVAATTIETCEHLDCAAGPGIELPHFLHHRPFNTPHGLGRTAPFGGPPDDGGLAPRG